MSHAALFHYHRNTWITIQFRASGYSLGKWPLLPGRGRFLTFWIISQHPFLTQVSSSLLSLYILYTKFYLLVAHIKTCELFKNSDHVLVSICRGTRLLSGAVTSKIWKCGREFSSTKQKKGCGFFSPLRLIRKKR